MSPTILITGASGRTSGFVLKALLQDPSPNVNLRLLVRSHSAVAKLRAAYPQLPESAFVIGDYLEASTLPPAFRSVDVVFHNAPAFSPLETAMGIAVIDAAKSAGVKHFVYCSVLHPILTKLLNHKVKRDVEEYLIESGMNYTILEPSSFMQNMNIAKAIESNSLAAPYTPTTLQGFLDLADLAAVARLVLLDPTPHNRARYELVGQNASINDVARYISEHLGRKIEATLVPRDKVLAAMPHALHLEGEMEKEGLDRMLYYYDRRGIPGNNNVLRWLLGREPTDWPTLLKRDLQS